MPAFILYVEHFDVDKDAYKVTCSAVLLYLLRKLCQSIHTD